jgi:virulence-associated protein VapD
VDAIAGNNDIRATDCVKATIDLDALFPWLEPSVRDIRTAPRATASGEARP